MSRQQHIDLLGDFSFDIPCLSIRAGDDHATKFAKHTAPINMSTHGERQKATTPETYLTQPIPVMTVTSTPTYTSTVTYVSTTFTPTSTNTRPAQVSWCEHQPHLPKIDTIQQPAIFSQNLPQTTVIKVPGNSNVYIYTSAISQPTVQQSTTNEATLRQHYAQPQHNALNLQNSHIFPVGQVPSVFMDAQNHTHMQIPSTTQQISLQIPPYLPYPYSSESHPFAHGRLTFSPSNFSPSSEFTAQQQQYRPDQHVNSASQLPINVSIDNRSNISPDPVQPPLLNHQPQQNAEELQQSRRPLPPLDKPTFTGNKSVDSNPLEFLRELEEYVFSFGGTHTQRLNLALSCLQGEARLFARAFRDQFETFEDFKILFHNHYWNHDVQRKVREELFKGVYKRRHRSNMAEHFLRVWTKIQKISVRPTERAFLNEIGHHFPRPIQHALRSLGDGTIWTAYQILLEEDRFENDTLKRNDRYRGSCKTTNQDEISNNNIGPHNNDNDSNNNGNSNISNNGRELNSHASWRRPQQKELSEQDDAWTGFEAQLDAES